MGHLTTAHLRDPVVPAETPRRLRKYLGQCNQKSQVYQIPQSEHEWGVTYRSLMGGNCLINNCRRWGAMTAGEARVKGVAGEIRTGVSDE